MVTVIVARPEEKKDKKPAIKISKRDNNWHIEVDNLHLTIKNSGNLPEFSWNVQTAR